MKPAGYLINTKEGLVGEPGMFYDYILGSDGLFIQAGGPLLEARIEIAPADVRGLAPVYSKVRLTKGKISKMFYHLATSIMAASSERERYLAITWEDDGYHLRDPWQDGNGGRVNYEVVPNTLLDMHSHGTMSAFFSGQDNHDEQGLKLYAVVGEAHRLLPDVLLRVGIYGYFTPIRFEEVFE